MFRVLKIVTPQLQFYQYYKAEIQVNNNVFLKLGVILFSELS